MGARVRPLGPRLTPRRGNERISIWQRRHIHIWQHVRAAAARGVPLLQTLP